MKENGKIEHNIPVEEAYVIIEEEKFRFRFNDSGELITDEYIISEKRCIASFPKEQWDYIDTFKTIKGEDFGVEKYRRLLTTEGIKYAFEAAYKENNFMKLSEAWHVLKTMVDELIKNQLLDKY